MLPGGHRWWLLAWHPWIFFKSLQLMKYNLFVFKLEMDCCNFDKLVGWLFDRPKNGHQSYMPFCSVRENTIAILSLTRKQYWYSCVVCNILLDWAIMRLQSTSPDDWQRGVWDWPWNYCSHWTIQKVIECGWHTIHTTWVPFIKRV